MLTTVLKLDEDGAPTGDLKVTNTALKELRYALKIRLPVEQNANPWLGCDPALITHKYFITRKQFHVNGANRIALFRGGFVPMDGAYEVVTEMQTRKATIVPMGLVDTDQTPYW